MDFRMTALAKGDQVVWVVGSTFRERNDVMDFIHRNNDAFLIAEFADWMSLYIFISDPFPGSAVAFMNILVPSVLVIISAFGWFMFAAVPSVRQVGTAWIAAGVLGFSRHLAHLPSGIRKALPISSKALFDSLLTMTYYTLDSGTGSGLGVAWGWLFSKSSTA